MRHERVKVVRDQNTVHNTAVAPWEIPVLEFIFGEESVTRQDEFEQVPDDRGYPDAGAELDRLVKVYGTDNSTGVPFAISVYGTASVGRKRMAEAIAAAKADDIAAGKPKRKRAGRTFSGDALLN